MWEKNEILWHDIKFIYNFYSSFARESPSAKVNPPKSIRQILYCIVLHIWKARRTSTFYGNLWNDWAISTYCKVLFVRISVQLLQTFLPNKLQINFSLTNTIKTHTALKRLLHLFAPFKKCQICVHQILCVKCQLTTPILREDCPAICDVPTHPT
jgi:hypothetical protein